MKIIEIGTGYTRIPPIIGAATEVVVHNLIKSFHANNIDVELVDITFNNNDENTFLNGIKVNYIALPAFLSRIDDKAVIHVLRRVLYSLKTALFLKKYLRCFDEKLVLHFHNQFNFIFYYFLNYKVKKNVLVMYTVHSPSWSLNNKISNKLLFEKIALLKSDIIITLTDQIKEMIGASLKIRADKMYPIPNGVDINTYYPIPEFKKENLLLSVGSVCRRKNQLNTIKIIKDFLVNNDYEYVFIGKIIDDKYFIEIQNYIDINNLGAHVKYGGEIKPGNELNIWYNKSKLYVSNSKSEAFSLVVLEALSAGVPVVLSEDFERSLSKFKNVYDFLRITDDNNMVNEVYKIVNSSKYKILCSECRNFINANYSWQKIAQEHLNIMRSD